MRRYWCNMALVFFFLGGGGGGGAGGRNIFIFKNAYCSMKLCNIIKKYIDKSETKLNRHGDRQREVWINFFRLLQ